ncbi:Receptor-type tyrosine-protein phosphatase alpha [Dirofilaria immitis]
MNGILPILSNKKPSNLEVTNTNLSKEKTGEDSNSRSAEESREGVEKQIGQDVTKKHLDSNEFSSVAGSKEHIGGNVDSMQEKTMKKISSSQEFSKEISDSKEFIKENHRRYRKSESKESIKHAIISKKSGSTESLRDGKVKYDKEKDHMVEKMFEKKIPKRKPRPYYYNELLDGISKSLYSNENDLPKISKQSSKPHFYDRTKDDDILKNLKEEKSIVLIKKRMPRPFCYDESLDGVTESLLSLPKSEDDKLKMTTTRNFGYPSTQQLSHPQQIFSNNRIRRANIVEKKAEESETGLMQRMENKLNLLKSDSSISSTKDEYTTNNALSAQKLVKGEDIMDFTYNYILSKKNLEEVMKLEHKFLLKQQQHISDFCKSEATAEGKNRSSTIVNFNEGAVRLIPTVTNDSRYIHASQINISYGNFIIAQGPTKQSLIDFFRMLWQYHVLLVVCLEPFTDQGTCYPYFSTKIRQIVQVEERISIETCKIIKTSVEDLFIYEAVLTNMEIRDSTNKRRIHIMRYDKWTHAEVISPILLVKMITVMEAINEKERKPIVVQGSYGIRRTAIFVITSLLMRQITETHRISILKAAIVVCRRRYGTLRFLSDYRLVLQSALYYAKQCNLIKNDKTFMTAMNILERKNR